MRIDRPQLSNQRLWLVTAPPTVTREALIDHLILRANRMAPALVESKQVPKLIVNESGNVVYANEVFLRLFRTVSIDAVYHLQISTRETAEESHTPANRPRKSRAHRLPTAIRKTRPDVLAFDARLGSLTVEFAYGGPMDGHTYSACAMPLRLLHRTFALLQLNPVGGADEAPELDAPSEALPRSGASAGAHSSA